MLVLHNNLEQDVQNKQPGEEVCPNNEVEGWAEPVQDAAQGHKVQIVH